MHVVVVMAPNPDVDGYVNTCVGEGCTQTDNVLTRCTFEEIDSALYFDFEAVGYSSCGTVNDSKNSLIQHIFTAFRSVIPSKRVHKSTQTFVNPVVAKAEKLAREVIFYFLQEELDFIHEDRLSLRMRNLVTEMLQKHNILFTRMMNSLRITPATARTAFTEVVNHLFSSGGVTWGRIVALYAFASRLAVHCKESGMHRLSRGIPLFMTECIEEKIAPFVARHGGWDQLCIEFPTEEHVNDKIWRPLLMTSIVMGIIAVVYSFAKLQPH